MKKIKTDNAAGSEEVFRKLFAEFLDAYFVRRDLKAVKKMLASGFSSFGTARQEFNSNQKEALKCFKAEMTEVPSSIAISDENFIFQPIDERNALIFGTYSIVVKIDTGEYQIPDARLTTVMTMVGNKALFTHIHNSIPQPDNGTGYSFPIRHLAEQLHDTEQKYRLVFDKAPVGILQYDVNGVIQACNSKFLQIMKSTEEKIIGLNMLKLKDKKASEAVRNSLDGKIGYYNGYYHTTTSNVITPLRALLTPMRDAAGVLIGGIGIYEDMSEFKDTENRLQYHFSFERMLSQIAGNFANATADEIDREIEKALKLSSEFFEAERGYIFTVDFDKRTLTCSHEWHVPEIESIKSKYQNFAYEHFEAIEHFFNRKAEYLHYRNVHDIDNDLKFKKILEEDHTYGIMLVPLMRNGCPIGLFGYDYQKDSHPWTGEEINLLKIIGEMLANSLARREAEHHRALAEIHHRQSEKADSLGKLAEAVAHQFNNQLQIVIGNLELLKIDNEERQKKKHNDAMRAAMKAAELSAMLMAYLGETYGKTPEERNRLQVSHAETLPRQLEGGSILVVEDDQMVRFITTSMLKHFNFEVIEACDGEEAIKILTSDANVRLIICDLIMPGLDGWQTLAAMRQKIPDLPFILASGYDDAMALKGSHTELPQAFLRKPFNAAGLQEAIRLALTS